MAIRIGNFSTDSYGLFIGTACFLMASTFIFIGFDIYSSNKNKNSLNRQVLASCKLSMSQKKPNETVVLEIIDNQVKCTVSQNKNIPIANPSLFIDKLT